MKCGQTPSQTVGPYFAYGLAAEQYGYPLTQMANGTIAGEGQRISVIGRVFDGKDEPIVDALVEIWHPEGGFARYGTGTSPDQSYTFSTVKPRRRSKEEAPHLTVVIFMRGLLSHLYTRIYFADEVDANKTDGTLNSLPDDRRKTLLATFVGPGQYQFDIHLQGEHETVFFDL
jgi:protocatechuate 3,4-dioxygenase, alpha subunit